MRLESGGEGLRGLAGFGVGNLGFQKPRVRVMEGDLCIIKDNGASCTNVHWYIAVANLLEVEYIRSVKDRRHDGIL